MLGFPGVLIRTSTERPEAVDKGTVVIGGVTEEDMVGAVELARGSFTVCNQNDVERRSTYDISSVNPGRSMRFTLFDNPEALPIDYRDIHVSDKVVRIIQSYTKIVNEMVWRK